MRPIIIFISTSCRKSLMGVINANRKNACGSATVIVVS